MFTASGGRRRRRKRSTSTRAPNYFTLPHFSNLDMKSIILTIAFCLPILALAEICPMENHQVCNQGNLACVCSVAQADENPVPLISCNSFIQREEETLNFPAVSIDFKLDKSTEGLEEWPEAAFREKLSSSLRVDEENILILRASCLGTDDELTVQFGVLKKEANLTDYPFQVEDFVSAGTLATRMKSMGHLTEIANLRVTTIEYVDELVDIEFEPSNIELIVKAVGLGIIFGVFFVMGVLKVFNRSDEYTDDLQKA
ncbi:unnamed protein product [Caenorhabditis angaria]|uniref:Uncharacterized protein n=1 Tax=Caenorhabditis angaria TaxID=860376 RepID=A0A9P1NCP5_9PELO|nr:unnamed protein product [Caenorhabditis angaria]